MLHKRYSNYEPKSFINDLIKKIIKLIGWKILATDYWACGKEAGTWLYGNTNKVKVIKNASGNDKDSIDNTVDSEEMANLKELQKLEELEKRDKIIEKEENKKRNN